MRSFQGGSLLGVMLGDGVQIAGMAPCNHRICSSCFMSPASRGMLLTGMIILYLFLGIVGWLCWVFVHERLSRELQKVGGQFLGPLHASSLDSIYHSHSINFNSLEQQVSTGAIPISLYLYCFPSGSAFQFPSLSWVASWNTGRGFIAPVRTNQIPRENSCGQIPIGVLVLVLAPSIGTLFIELFFVLFQHSG